MNDVVFIGDHRDVTLFRSIGIPSYAPPLGRLTERVLAERSRCRVIAMTEDTLKALPASLARELRESTWPRLEIVPDQRRGPSLAKLIQKLQRPSSGPRVAMA